MAGGEFPVVAQVPHTRVEAEMEVFLLSSSFSLQFPAVPLSLPHESGKVGCKYFLSLVPE